MNIIVTVQLAEGDVINDTPAEIANGVFSALGGDEMKDFCQVTIVQPPPPPGLVGTPSPSSEVEE